MKRNKFQDDKLVEHLISIPNYLDWICFFLMFSRFEYALKRAGYLKKGTRVEADWKKFGEEIEGKFAAQKCKELGEAIQYLEEKPPRIQIQNNGKLDWCETPLEKGDIQGCADAVKRVRNNLFHGGKYPSGPVTDPSRDRELIRHSITVLKYLLELSNEVSRYYFESLEVNMASEKDG